MKGNAMRIFTNLLTVGAGIMVLVSSAMAADEVDPFRDPANAAAPPALITAAEGQFIIDHRDLVAVTLPSQLAERHVLLATGPGDTALFDGLAAHQALASLVTLRDRAQERFFRSPGIGQVRVGTRSDPTSRIERFSQQLAARHVGANLDLAMLSFDARDVAGGAKPRTVRVGYWRRMTTFEVRAFHIGNAGSFVENINAVTTVGNQPVVAQFPIELPNREVTGLKTTVSVPSGVGALPLPLLANRHPVAVFRRYRQHMEQLAAAHPNVRFVWSTVGLSHQGNYQRNWFNSLVRIHASQESLPLYDRAAILAHNADGVAAVDHYGPTLAPEWHDGEGRLTAAAEARLASGFIALLAEDWGDTAAVVGVGASEAALGKESSHEK